MEVRATRKSRILWELLSAVGNQPGSQQRGRQAVAPVLAAGRFSCSSWEQIGQKTSGFSFMVRRVGTAAAGKALQ